MQRWVCANPRTGPKGPHARDRVPAGCPLTNGQYETLALVAEGLSLKEIALRRSCSTSTVQSTLTNTYAVLGAAGRGQTTAVVVMKDSGWLGAPPREPQQRDDSRDVTPTQRAYNEWFVRLCRSPGELGEAATATAAKLMSVDAAAPFASRDARAPHRPDIDTLLLRMALAFTA